MRMLTVALAIAGIVGITGLCGSCHRVSHERRVLAASDIADDQCRIVIWDLGEELARREPMVWATRFCMDGSTQETEISDGAYFRGGRPAVWTSDGMLIVDPAPIIRFGARKP